MRPSPDERLLLLASSLRAVGGRDARLATAALEGVDWDRLVGLAERHGVVPAVAEALGRLDPTAVALPAPARRRLRAALREIAWGQLRHSAELFALLDALAEAGLSAIPHRGPALAAWLRGPEGLRDVEDLDLLVRPADLRAVQDRVARLGYEPVAGARAGDHVRLARADRHLVLNLRWTIEAGPGSRVELSDLWGRPGPPAEMAGRAVPFPRAEDVLVLLCAHGTKRRWQFLKWSCDLECLALTRAPDWAEVARVADAWGCTAAVGLGLAMAAELLGLPLDDPIASGLAAGPGVARAVADCLPVVLDGSCAIPEPARAPSWD